MSTILCDGCPHGRATCFVRRTAMVNAGLFFCGPCRAERILQSVNKRDDFEPFTSANLFPTIGTL